MQPPGKAASDAFERTGMGGGDSHITTRKTRDWVSSRDSRRELEEEEVETLARSSSAHGQSAGSRQVRTDARNGAPLWALDPTGTVPERRASVSTSSSTSSRRLACL